jgi:hypothetical protein
MIVVPEQILEALDSIRKGKTKADTTTPLIEAAIQWYLCQQGHGEQVPPLLDNRVTPIGPWLAKRFKDGITPSPGGPSLVLWTDKDGKHPHFVNTPGAFFAGRQEDVLRHHVWKRIPGEQGEMAVEYIRTCLDMGTVGPMNLELVTPSGQKFTEIAQCHAISKNVVLTVIRNQVAVPEPLVAPGGLVVGSGP